MRTRKGLMFAAGIVIILVAVGFWWWRGRSSKPAALGESLKPTVSVASMSITDIDADRIKMTSRVTFSNPLPVELNTNRLDYELYIDSVKVMESSYEKPISVKPSDSSTIELPMEILTKPMKNVLEHFDKHKVDSADYTFKASMEVNVPIAGERRFTKDVTKRLPAIRIPKIKPGKMDIDKLGLKESSLDMVVNVENPNAFALKMKDGRYTVLVDKKLKMDGVIEKIVNIPAHGAAPVSMSLDIKTAKLGKLGWKMLFDKKDTEFKVDFKCKLLTDNDILKNSNMAFTVSGTLEELKEIKEN